MRLDLTVILKLCEEVGLRCVHRSPDEVSVQLEPGVSLRFLNFPNEADDCLIGFDGSEWHTHGRLMCSDRHGYYIELNYLDLVTGLADGTVLVCELWARGALADRWLVHRDFVNEFRHMRAGEEIRIRRVANHGIAG